MGSRVKCTYFQLVEWSKSLTNSKQPEMIIWNKSETFFITFLKPRDLKLWFIVRIVSITKTNFLLNVKTVTADLTNQKIYNIL